MIRDMSASVPTVTATKVPLRPRTRQPIRLREYSHPFRGPDREQNTYHDAERGALYGWILTDGWRQGAARGPSVWLSLVGCE